MGEGLTQTVLPNDIAAGSSHQDTVATFIVTWVALGISSFLFFQFNKNATLKRRIFVPFVIITGILFGCFVAFMTRGHLEILYIAIPMIALISFLNIRK